MLMTATVTSGTGLSCRHDDHNLFKREDGRKRVANYIHPRAVLLARDGHCFKGSEEERLAAATELNTGDIDALVVIADYWKMGQTQHVQEPHETVATALRQIWDTSILRYRGLRPERFLDHVAVHYLERLPSADEVLSPPAYEQIFHAFQSLMIPSLHIGRVDALVAGRVRSNTLQKIIEGYEEFRYFSQER